MATVHQGPDETSPDLRRDEETQDDAAQVGTEASVAVRNEAGDTLRVSFWKASAIEARAERRREMDAPSGLSAWLESQAEERREKAKEDRQQLSQLADILRDQQEERDRWMNTQATVGGVTMTGADWLELSKRMREDDELRSRVLAAFMARGMSEREAEARYERAADVSEIMSIPPTQWTDAQRETVAKAKADPTFNEDMAAIQEFQGRDVPRDHKSALGVSFDSAASGSALASPANSPQTPQPTQVAELGL